MPDTDSTNSEVTKLLAHLSKGDRGALDELFPLVYKELRSLAHSMLRDERNNLTLRTTELVHEAYMKLVDHHEIDFQDRRHFFAVAARAMRQVIVDQARKRTAEKRGGNLPTHPLEEATLKGSRSPVVVLAVHHALEQLADLHERQVRVVECRFFGGYTIKETANVLDVSTRTVQRDWRAAKAWLRRELQD